MSDYKRLTKQAGWHKDIDLKDELGYSYIYQRLAELENKIEQGTLIELPCKVGDTVYLPWVWNGTSSIAYLTVNHIIIDRSKSFVKTDFYTDDEDYWSTYNCGEFDFTDFGKIVFLTREEAENKLKELQNGRN